MAFARREDWARSAAALLAAGLWVATADARAQATAEAQATEQAPRCHRADDAAREICIRVETYSEDICAALAHYADAAELDRGFFARLIWQESRFDANAVSPMNAQGVAQFIPSTAALRGLKDPFNPAEALAASATYLAELAERFGNLGLAAAAYNAGEGRAAALLAGKPFAPAETRAYVETVTGHEIEAWLADPAPEPDFVLAEDRPFEAACLAMATTRQFRRFKPALSSPPPKAWGVQIAIHGNQQVARRLFRQVEKAHRPVIGGETLYLTRERGGPRGLRRRFIAQVGRDSRADALALCARIRARGGVCKVLKN